MSLVAHSSFRLSNSDEEVLLVSDNIDDLFAINSEPKPRQQLPLQRRSSFRKRSTPPKVETRSSPVQPQLPSFLIVTEELLRLVIDPITLCIMMDPVLAADHCTYDRDSITKWLITKGSTPNPQGYVRLPKVPSPCTGNDLPNHTLTPNATVKTLVELVVSSMQKQDASHSPPLPEYHDDLLRDYLQRLNKLQREQRTAENMKKLYGAHCCPLKHPLTLIRCGALPREYQTSQRSLESISCSHCMHANIACINWYFHCDTCTSQSHSQECEGGHVAQIGYDICANCIANHRSHPVSPNNNATGSNNTFFGGRAASMANLSSTTANAAETTTMTEAERDAIFYNYPVKPTAPMPHMSPLQQQQQFLRRCFSMRVPPTATATTTTTGTANIVDVSNTNVSNNNIITNTATSATINAIEVMSDEFVTAVTEELTLTTATSTFPTNDIQDTTAATNNDEQNSNHVATNASQDDESNNKSLLLNTHSQTNATSVSADLAAAIAAAVSTAMVSSDVLDEDDHVYPFLSTEEPSSSSAFSQKHHSSKLRRAQTTMSGKAQSMRKIRSTNMQTIRPSKHTLDTSFSPIMTPLEDSKGSEKSSKSSKKVYEKKSAAIPRNTYLDVVDAEDLESLQGSKQYNNVLNNIDWPEETLAMMERETRQRRIQRQGVRRQQQLQHFHRSHTSANIVSQQPREYADNMNHNDARDNCSVTDSAATVAEEKKSESTVSLLAIQTATGSGTGAVDANMVDTACPVAAVGDTPVTHQHGHRTLMRHVVSGLFASFSPKHSHTAAKSIDNHSEDVSQLDNCHNDAAANAVGRHNSLRRTASHRKRHGVRRFFSMHYYNHNNSVASDSD